MLEKGRFFIPNQLFYYFDPPSPTSRDGRVVKALDSKSNGIFPHRFESCSRRKLLQFSSGKEKINEKINIFHDVFNKLAINKAGLNENAKVRINMFYLPWLDEGKINIELGLGECNAISWINLSLKGFWNQTLFY